MYAILMVLALGFVGDDPELVAEEVKAVRTELVTVRADLRRIKAREEAQKSSKDKQAEAAIQELENRITRIKAFAANPEREVTVLTKQLEGLRSNLNKPKLAPALEEQQAYLTALEKLLLADLKRLTGR